MPKVKDVLNIINSRINSQEFSTALAASDGLETDISEDGFNEIKTQVEGMTTINSAINDPSFLAEAEKKLMPEIETKLEKKFKAELYHNPEKRLTELGDKLGIDMKGKFLNDQISSLFTSVDKFKSGDKETDEALRKENSDLNAKLAKLTEDSEAKINEITTSKNGEVNQFIVNSILDKQLDSYQFSTAYQEPLVKEAMKDKIKEKVLEKAHLQLGEDKKSILIRRKDNPELELHENNKPVGLKDLIDPLAQPFTKAVEKNPKTVVVDPITPGANAQQTNPNSTLGMMRAARGQ